MTDEDKKFIVEQYLQGNSLRGIKRMMSNRLSHESIRTILEREGVNIRPPGGAWKKELAAMGNRDKEIADFYKVGHSLRTTGVKFGISYERVRQILKRDNVEIAPRGRRQRNARNAPKEKTIWKWKKF